MSVRASPAARALARRYPFLPFRGRLRWLDGRAGELPDGVVARTRNGARIRVHADAMYRDVFFWGDYEPYATKILARLVRPGDVAIDVGANFGWFAVQLARLVGPTGQVHAFEPVPFIHELARENLVLNGLSDAVILNRTALGATEGTLVLRSFAGLPHGHTTAAPLARADAVEHPCALTTLDAYCRTQQLARVDLLKVDVEGFEPDVFEGGRETLSRDDAPLVAFELNAECLPARGLTPQQVLRPLRACGYELFAEYSVRRGARLVDPTAIGPGNVLAAKPERADTLRRALETGRLLR